jgi:hypothetical protein
MDAPQAAAAQARARTYTCFGISVESQIPFPGSWGAGGNEAEITRVLHGELTPPPGPSEEGWHAVIDRQPLVVGRSSTGEHWFSHGGQMKFRLSADHLMLTADPRSPRDTRWWRLLLDSVLFSVSLLRGNDALHAGAVSTAAGAVAVMAGSGGGKSTLLAQLVQQGCSLVTDDVLFLKAADGEVAAFPGPPFMTLPRHRAARIGSPVGDVDDEIWVSVPVVAGPLPLRRVVLLDRRPGAPTTLEAMEQPLFPLLTHLLNFPPTRDRELGRFSLASAVTTGAELCRLLADVGTPPQELATHVLQGLAE